MSPLLTGRFFNPLVERAADPSIVRTGGFYYLVLVDGFHNITIRRSATLDGLHEATPSVVWRPPACPAAACAEVWAPELQLVDGTWWIYFAAENGGGNASHRMYALSGRGPNPDSLRLPRSGRAARRRVGDRRHLPHSSARELLPVVGMAQR
ncbi:hypothetical protein GCM10011609_88090 [Lentzea pudingi]|uniref:Glycosyl hydrolases family 43 n=1 Tax=Lentzea pudingi TaxID=1789439 RepID=A0ABQ2IUS0_9PSEU|nr:family 43 glycosylhydrolase [Lentzea pudingi]GGN30346.1 hypothetical protein GCM10011609_88090 [Lentzea pudingi]